MNNTSNTVIIRRSTYTASTVIIIISVLALAFIAVYLYNQYKEYNKKMLGTNITQGFAICPNYWDSIGNGKCQNTHLLGSCSNNEGANIMDFSGQVFTNKNTGDYAKCKWARACNVSWSGVERLC
jgi:hypothetical protein